MEGSNGPIDPLLIDPLRGENGMKKEPLFLWIL